MSKVFIVTSIFSTSSMHFSVSLLLLFLTNGNTKIWKHFKNLTMIDDRTPAEETQYQTIPRIPRKYISRQSSILLTKSKCLNRENLWTHLIFYTRMFKWMDASREGCNQAMQKRWCVLKRLINVEYHYEICSYKSLEIYKFKDINWGIKSGKYSTEKLKGVIYVSL